jgi:PadR family transcriptional regulator, regulatory protein PadR
MSTTRSRRITDLNLCPCAGGTLDKLIQPAILAILAGGPLHGYRLAERIAQMPGFAGPKPDISGIYRFLKAMEVRGFVISSWDVSGAGPAKKSYRITPAGQQCLQKWITTLKAYSESVLSLLKVAQAAAKQRPAAAKRPSKKSHARRDL